MKSKMLAHRIGKRRAIRIGILTQKTTDQLDGVLLGQGAFDLVLNFHGATINAARKNVQHYLSAMGRTSPYAVGIRPATTVWAPGTAPLPPKAWVGRGARTTKLRRESGNEPVSARALAMRLDSQAWRTVTWREGANDTLSGRFAALRVRPAHRDYLQTAMRAEEWLLIEWPEGEKEPVKYFLSTAPEDATLEQMVFACKMRWRIERDYQDLMQDFGLGHYEGRGWRGFHHHATLSIVAYGS